MLWGQHASCWITQSLATFFLLKEHLAFLLVCIKSVLEIFDVKMGEDSPFLALPCQVFCTVDLVRTKSVLEIFDVKMGEDSPFLALPCHVFCTVDLVRIKSVLEIFDVKMGEYSPFLALPCHVFCTVDKSLRFQCFFLFKYWIEDHSAVRQCPHFLSVMVLQLVHRVS